MELRRFLPASVGDAAVPDRIDHQRTVHEPESFPLTTHSAQPPAWHWWAAIGICLLSLVARFPFVGTHPLNWDAAQFGLGTVQFDLAAHQPHPPGYPLYVIAGAFVSAFSGDPLIALASISWLFGGLAILPTYALGRMLVGSRSALFGCVILASSPLSWFYGSVGLTYAVEGFFASFIAWQLWRSKHGHPAGLLVAACGLAIAGGVRPSSLPFLLPAFVWCAWGQPRRIAVQSVLLLTVGTLLWLGPLMLLTGGVTEYLRVNTELGLVVAPATSPLGGLGTMLANLGQTLLALNFGLHLGLPVLIAAMLRRYRGRDSVGSDRLTGTSISIEEISVLGPSLFQARERWFFAVLTLPAVLFFGFVHLGQPGYLLLVLGAFCLMAGRATEYFAVRLAVRSRQRLPLIRLAMGFLFVMVGLAGFWFSPGILGIRSLQIERQGWDQARLLISEQPVSETMILTGLWAKTYFRTAQLEFPHHVIHAVGHRGDGNYASLYHVVDGRVSQTFSDIGRDGPLWSPIHVTPAVKRIIVLDDEAFGAALATPEISAFGQPRVVTVAGVPSIWVFDRP